jgi:hypothetical protein
MKSWRLHLLRERALEAASLESIVGDSYDCLRDTWEHVEENCRVAIDRLEGVDVDKSPWFMMEQGEEIGAHKCAMGNGCKQLCHIHREEGFEELLGLGESASREGCGKEERDQRREPSWRQGGRERP